MRRKAVGKRESGRCGSRCGSGCGRPKSGVLANLGRGALGVLLAFSLVPAASLGGAWAAESSADDLPTSFYLTNAGAVTDVKFQNPWSSCWAFAACAAVESSILVASGQADLDEGVSDTPQLSGLPTSADGGSAIDLSEHALAWFAHEVQTEESAGTQAGEGLYLTKGLTSDTQLLDGEPYLAESILTSWQALTLESTAPYAYLDADGTFHTDDLTWSGLDACAYDWSLDEDVRLEEDSGWRVTGTVELPSPVVTETDPNDPLSTVYAGYDESATEAIKQTLMETGAVTIAYEADQSVPTDATDLSDKEGEYFDYDNWCQYNDSDSSLPDHAVTIVGWDDNYSASNFNGTKMENRPEGDGAWLVKNNWASYDFFTERGYDTTLAVWGIEDGDGNHSGFFWLSYYDHTIGTPVAYEVTADDVYDNNYQYDYLGVSQINTCVTLEGTVGVANVFEADSSEYLEAVSAWTSVQDVEVTTEVYLIDADATDPTGGGDPVWEGKETFDYGGFHTIDLDEPIYLKEGQRFAVVQYLPCEYEDPETLETSAGGYLNLETALLAEMTAETELSGQVVVNEGESYVFLEDSGWSDVVDLFWSEEPAEGEVFAYGNALIKAFTTEAPVVPDESTLPESTPDSAEETGGQIVATDDEQPAEAASGLAKTGDDTAPLAFAAFVIALSAAGVARIASSARRRASGVRGK